MKLSLFATLATATLTAVTTVAAQKDGHYDSLDTTRGPKLFEPPKARRGGYTYLDEWSVKVDAEMDSQGMAFKGSFNALLDTKMTVTDMADNSGNQKVDLNLQSAKGGIDSFLMTIHCDSEDRTDSAPDCEPLFDVIGAEESMILSPEGEVLELTTPDGETMTFEPVAELEPEAQLVQQVTLASKFRDNQFAAAHHFDKSQQLLKLIPDHAVSPGDSWIDDVDMQGMGTFKGNSYLKGYTTYEGVDCAVFEFEGSLKLDVTQLAQVLGVEDTTMLPETEVDAEILNEIIWDFTDDISRWAQVNITTAFDIPNPMNPEDPVPVHVPVVLVLSLNTDIIDRPAHADDPAAKGAGASESAYVPPAVAAPTTPTTSSNTESQEYRSSYSDSNSDKKKGRGWGTGIFFALLVGMGAAGFVVYKKREGQDAFFVRPSYSEFSPVGNEPIFNTPMM